MAQMEKLQRQLEVLEELDDERIEEIPREKTIPVVQSRRDWKPSVDRAKEESVKALVKSGIQKEKTVTIGGKQVKIKEHYIGCTPEEYTSKGERTVESLQ